jgi:hypothetical protein
MTPEHLEKLENSARKLDFLERRNNLVVRGLLENQNETDEQLTNLANTLIADLGVTGAKPDVVSRRGRKVEGRNRPVLLQYEHQVRSDKVWSARFGTRSLSKYQLVYIDADLPVEVRKQQFLDPYTPTTQC